MQLSLSRREFLAGGAAFAAFAGELRPFPPGFLWGASTSALQIEGALAEDGRGPSIWETFCRRPQAIADGSTPEPACDHYHRWREDVALIKAAGFSAYRFSVAWPRVLPQGAGAVNPRGLDFYDRLVDGLLAAGVRPMPCLYHWDLPQPLQDQGGWLNRDIAGRFADYARAVAGRLGDRVQDWFCLNEPSVSAIFGHGYAEHAPGLNGGERAALGALYHHNLAQGTALSALRAEKAGFRLGTVLSLQPVVPSSDSPADRDAAIRWDALWNRVALDGVMRGRLPDVLAAGLDPWVKPGDLEIIRFPLDRLGVNYYSPMGIQYQPGRLLDAGFGPLQAGRSTAMGWPVVPQGLYQILTELKELYGNPDVLITENGAAYDDHPGPDGRVADQDRIGYLRDHLAQVARALADGCKVSGYLVWSLLDNWEWQEGYRRRFGVVYVDYVSQRRLPKDSFAWLQATIRAGRPGPG
jgi:beta-glucosidase